MTTALAKLALVPTSITEVEQLSGHLAKSQLVPDAFKNKPHDIFLAIGYGQELGLPPIASLRAIVVIKGKASLYADAMVGIVLSRGVAEYFIAIESSPDRAIYETKRRGAPEPVRKSFSIEDAKNAGLLTNHNYKAYPRHMLEARAKAWLARDCYPDLLHGIYSAEEVSEFSEPATPIRSTSSFHAPGASKIIDAELVEPANGLVAEFLAASNHAELEAVAAKAKGTKGEERARLGRAYKARKQELDDERLAAMADEFEGAEAVS